MTLDTGGNGEEMAIECQEEEHHFSEIWFQFGMRYPKEHLDRLCMGWANGFFLVLMLSLWLGRTGYLASVNGFHGWQVGNLEA